MFAASDADDERRVLEAKLPTHPKYRRVSAPRLVEFVLLLPTFRSPHGTMLFTRPGVPGDRESSSITQFLDVLDESMDDPAYRPRDTRGESRG
jgi:hypothetical protein